MKNYDVIIINSLLDVYENSLLYSGENKVNIHISFRFNKKTIPDYFEESTDKYIIIHDYMEKLETKGIISIGWKNNKVNHVIDKVVLNLDMLDEAYKYINRSKKNDLVEQQIEIIEKYCSTSDENTYVLTKLCNYLIERLRNNLSVKEYIDINSLADTEALLKFVKGVEQNISPCYIREFSIKTVGDSKLFASIEGRVIKAFRKFNDKFSDLEKDDILAEYNIYCTPNYVYIKGNVEIGVKGQNINLINMSQGIGISGDDLENLSIVGCDSINKVVTIENLTTFFSCNVENAIIIYLGGYHNRVRRKLLEIIYNCLPKAKFLHFGDIDAGGFCIYKDLCIKTGIPFSLYNMSIEMLDQYKSYGKILTVNDKARLSNMLSSDSFYNEEIKKLISYMLENNIKLEQECIACD